MTRVETKNGLRRSLALVASCVITLGLLWFALSHTASSDSATTDARPSMSDTRANADADLDRDAVLGSSPDAHALAEPVASVARQAAAARAGRTMHITVSDELDQPLAGVDLDVYVAISANRRRAATRGDGTCDITIPPRADGAKDAQVAVSISTRAPGRRDAFRAVRESEFGGGESADVRIVLGLGAELHLDLFDVAGARASRAIVLARWLDDGDDPPSRDKPDDAVPSYRTGSDAGGNVDLRGLLPGRWTVRTLAWREWLDSDPHDVVLAPGAKRTETLTIERRPLAEYMSGVVTGLVFNGDGSDTSGFYLRRASDRQPTIGVLNDGAFFSDDDRFSSDEWELFDSEGESRGGRLRLELGRHDLVLDVAAK